MKVTIAVPGRFQPAYHFARYLEARGQLGRLITPIPYRRGRYYGVSRQRTVPLSAFAYWYHGFERYGVNALKPLNQLAYSALFDRVASSLFSGADVFNGWSTIALHSIRRARRRRIPSVLVTGSTHIEWQTQTLREEFRRFSWDGPLTHPRLVARAVAEYEEADAIVVPSRFSLATFIESGVPDEKLFLIPWTIRPLTKAPRERPGRPVARILYVGQCTLRKGLPYLFEAFRRLETPATLRLVGPPEPALITRLGGLPKGVEAVGPKYGTDLAEEYRQADGFVLASIEEGSAFVVSEAMAAGLPVVVTDHCGADQVQDGVNGFVVPARDPTLLARRLDELVSDPELRSGMGSRAAASVTSRSWHEYGAELHDRVVAPLASGRVPSSGKGAA